MKKWLVACILVLGVLFSQIVKAETLQEQKETAKWTTLQVELLSYERTGDWERGSFKQAFRFRMSLGFVDHTRHPWSEQKRNVTSYERKFNLYFYVNGMTGRNEEIEVKQIRFDNGLIGQAVEFVVYQEQLMRRKPEIIFLIDIGVEQVFGSFGRYDVPQRCHEVEIKDSCIQPIPPVEVQVKGADEKGRTKVGRQWGD